MQYDAQMAVPQSTNSAVLCHENGSAFQGPLCFTPALPLSALLGTPLWFIYADERKRLQRPINCWETAAPTKLWIKAS